MATQLVRGSRSAGSGNVATKRFTLADTQQASAALANRYGLHAREGWGKTSLAAHAPKPIFIQTRGETGLDTLISNGQLPQTPHFPEIQTWDELTAAIRFLIDEQHPYRTLVLDTVNGAERLCYEHVCHRDFNDEWGDKGFGGYQRGYEVSQAEWRMFLNALDDLRRAKNMTVFFLIHTKVKTFKNPEGADFDRWAPDMHEKCWGLTHKWLDCVLFGNFETVVSLAKSDKGDVTKKGKAATDSCRMLYTQQRPAFDAKNRLGLPEEIEMGNSATEAWQALTAAIKSSRKMAAPAEEVPAQTQEHANA